MTTEYTSVSIPKKLAERIEEFRALHPEEGYTSMTDFIKDAIRTLLEAKYKNKIHLRKDLPKEIQNKLSK